jgi:hypothetical protein
MINDPPTLPTLDLEKRQSSFRSGVRKPLPPHIVKLDDGTTLTLRPAGTGLFSAIKGKSVQTGMEDHAHEGEHAGSSVPKEHRIPGSLEGTTTAGTVGYEMRKRTEL